MTGDPVFTNAATIGERAFYDTIFTSFSFGNKLATLGDLALFDQNLSSITVDENNSSFRVIDGVLYKNNSTVIVQYPAKMHSTGFTVSDTVTEILHYAFYAADIDGKLTIPNKSPAIRVGEHAFNYTKFSAVELPVNIPSAHLLEYCSNIAEYTFTGTVSGLDANYYIANADYLAWKFTDPSLDVTVTFVDGVTALDPGMFSGFSRLTVLSIPTSVSCIGADSLKGCTGLTTLTVPIILNMAVNAGSGVTGLTTIHFIGSGAGYDYADSATGAKVLWYNSTISSLTIDSGITSIGSYSYLKVTGPITLPNTVTEVGDYAFYGSTTAHLTISTMLRTVGAYAFSGIAVTSVNLPNTLTFLGDMAFGNCSLLRSVVIPDSLASYEGAPFGECAALNTVTLPISIDYSLGMFTGCPALKNFNFTKGTGTGVDYTGKNTDTPWYAVVQGSNDIKVDFGIGINSIGAHMFDGCNYAPSAITTYGIIGSGANKEVVLSSVSVIGEYAFNGCTGLTSVTIPMGTSRSALILTVIDCTSAADIRERSSSI
jgi:hypothetical protein